MDNRFFCECLLCFASLRFALGKGTDRARVNESGDRTTTGKKNKIEESLSRQSHPMIVKRRRRRAGEESIKTAPRCEKQKLSTIAALR